MYVCMYVSMEDGGAGRRQHYGDGIVKFVEDGLSATSGPCGLALKYFYTGSHGKEHGHY